MLDACVCVFFFLRVVVFCIRSVGLCGGARSQSYRSSTRRHVLVPLESVRSNLDLLAKKRNSYNLMSSIYRLYIYICFYPGPALPCPTLQFARLLFVAFSSGCLACGDPVDRLGLPAKLLDEKLSRGRQRSRAIPPRQRVPAVCDHQRRALEGRRLSAGEDEWAFFLGGVVVSRRFC